MFRYSSTIPFAFDSFAEYIIPTLSTLNSLDDAFTNSKEESGLQQVTSDKGTKNIIGNIKGGVSILNVTTGGLNPKETLKSPFRIIGMGTDAVSSGQFVKQKVDESTKPIKKE